MGAVVTADPDEKSRPVVIAERLETKTHLVDDLVRVVLEIPNQRFRWRLIHQGKERSRLEPVNVVTVAVSKMFLARINTGAKRKVVTSWGQQDFIR
jgi:hypothetical protein